MKGPTHFLGGTLAGLVLLNVATPDTTTAAGLALGAAALGVAALGSLFPDIDHENSTVSHKMRLTSLLYRGVAAFARVVHIEGFEHRGIMHTMIFPLIIMLLAIFLKNPAVTFLLWAFFAGYVSHLLLDALNPTGVPLLAPFFNLKVRLLPRSLCIKTGSFSELFVMFGLMALIILAGIPVLSLLKVVFSEIFSKIRIFFRNTLDKFGYEW